MNSGLMMSGVSRALAAASFGAMTWDPSNKAATDSFQTGNLEVFNSSTTTGDNTHALHSNARTSGKYYAEFQILTTPTANVNAIGLVQTANDTSGFLGAAGEAAWYFFAGNWGVNNSALTGSIKTVTTQTVLGMAVDLENGRIWWRAVSSTNWNNNASYDPATNVGGIDISSITGSPVVPAASVCQSSFRLLANFGGSAYSMTAPSGFGNW